MIRLSCVAIAGIPLLAQVSPVPDASAGPWGALTQLGLVGALLWYIFYIHLPAERKQSADAADKKDAQLDKKDAQLRELLESAAAERELDRKSRHELANNFQAVHFATATALKEENAKERDRADARNERLVGAFEHQTQELKAAIAGSCQYTPPRRSPPANGEHA